MILIKCNKSCENLSILNDFLLLFVKLFIAHAQIINTTYTGVFSPYKAR